MADALRDLEDSPAAILRDAIRKSEEIQYIPKQFAPHLDKALVVLPAGKTIADLEKFQHGPDKVVASPNHIKVESFIEYVNRFKLPETIIEGSFGGSKFTARIDYHSAPQILLTPAEMIVEVGKYSTPSWNTWNPTLSLVTTGDYKKIKAMNEKAFDQLAFVQELESLEHCIVLPEVADISDMVLKFESMDKVTFASKVSRSDGKINLTYKEEDETEGKVKLPAVIVFKVAVYEASAPIEIQASVRYRTGGGSLTLFIEIPDFDRIEREAFYQVAEDIELGTRDLKNFDSQARNTGTGIKPYILA